MRGRGNEGGRLGAIVEEGFEAGVARAADGEASAVGEDGDAAVFAVRLDAGDALEIHDVGTMNTDEAIGVEAGFEARDSLLLEVFFAFGGEGDVIILGFGEIELGDGNQNDASAVADDEAIEKLFGRASGGGEFMRRRDFGEAGFGALESGVETLAADGLQKIVHGMNVKGAHGVLVVGSDENDGNIGANELENVKAGKFGHLDVEENQVGFMSGDGFDGFEAIGAFGDDFDFGVRLDELAKNEAGEVFIVHEKSAELRGGGGAQGRASLT